MDTSYEPMDIDKSASSTSKMDISLEEDIINLSSNHEVTLSNRKSAKKPVKFFKESPKTFIKVKTEKLDEASSKPNSTIKTYHIKLEKKPSPSNVKRILLSLVILLIALLIYKIINFKCSRGIDSKVLRKDLAENLFGQSAAATKIIESLNISESKILFLYGGTGVGKTFAVSLMLNNMWDSSNVYHYTMPTFTEKFSPELMLGLILCDNCILVVDDLTKGDNISSQIESVIRKSRKLGKIITIVLVYNCDDINNMFVKKCDHLFHHELENHFRTIDVVKQFIKFESLNEIHLKKCIEKELGSKKVSLQEMNNIVKNFDVTLDGCKGVYKKMKFLNVM